MVQKNTKETNKDCKSYGTRVFPSGGGGGGD